MKHLVAVSRTSGPLRADILGTRAFVGLLTELMVLISGVSQLLQEKLNKDPSTTHVVIDEVDTDNWGVGHESVSHMRARLLVEANRKKEQVQQK